MDVTTDDGGGPRYSASVFHAVALGGATVCVMGAVEREFGAEDVVFDVLDHLAARRSRSHDVLRLVLGRGLSLVGIGVGCGVALSHSPAVWQAACVTVGSTLNSWLAPVTWRVAPVAFEQRPANSAQQFLTECHDGLGVATHEQRLKRGVVLSR